jgi:hypothetical protein
MGIFGSPSFARVGPTPRRTGQPALCFASGKRLISGCTWLGTRATSIGPGNIVILPITTQRPPTDQVAIELSPDEKRLCRLDPGVPSWVIVSEFNADIWPNADLSLAPETGEIFYGIARPGLLARIGRAFADARRTRRIVGVKR